MIPDETRQPRPQGRSLALTLLPLAIAFALAALFYVRLNAGDPARLPSTLLGRPAPPLQLEGLDGRGGLADADLRSGHVTLVNMFQTSCAPCHVEHPYLMTLATDPELAAAGVKLVGVAQKDGAEDVRRYLGAKGDPYAKVGLDKDGRAGIDWGAYGVPETYVVRGDGVVVFKYVGPVGADEIAHVLKPEIRKALRAAS